MPNPRRNYRRRSIGLLACASPFLLLLASLVYGWTRDRGSDSARSLAFMSPAVAMGALNVSLSFIRPMLHRLRHGSMERYRFLSGFPMVGVFLIAAGAFTGFGGRITALLGIFAMLLDTGGPFWFLLATWNDATFWDD